MLHSISDLSVTHQSILTIEIIAVDRLAKWSQND
jgi:hypothetical protein